jgi:hypothetical protein
MTMACFGNAQATPQGSTGLCSAGAATPAYRVGMQQPYLKGRKVLRVTSCIQQMHVAYAEQLRVL